MQGLNRGLSVGIGLRSTHYAHILKHKPKVSWFEAISENYLGIEGGEGARPLETLLKIRNDYPVVLHGVSLSIGTTDPLNFNYLRKLKELYQIVEPEWVSDHVCWTGVQGENLHDLLPLPYTEETLGHLSERILAVQEFLGRKMAFENVSAYISYRHNEMTEWQFLSELCRRTDCDLLLDVNNVYVSAANLGFSAESFLRALPAEQVRQMHLAGHSQGTKCLVDTHDEPVCDAVWSLYETAVGLFPQVPTLIEWDDKIPEFERLLQEAGRAQKVWSQSWPQQLSV